MDMEKLAQMFEAVKVLPLRPNDTIVITTKKTLSSDQREYIKEQFMAAFGGRTVVVLADGMDIQVCRNEIDGDSVKELIQMLKDNYKNMPVFLA